MFESARRRGDGMIDALMDGVPTTIPDDFANVYRQRLAEWVMAGGVIEDAATGADDPDPSLAFVPVSLVRQRVERLGLLEPFAAYIAANPPLMMKLLTLEAGIDPAYPALIDAFDEMQVPPIARAYILAPPAAGVGDPPNMG